MIPAHVTYNENQTALGMQQIAVRVPQDTADLFRLYGEKLRLERMFEIVYSDAASDYGNQARIANMNSRVLPSPEKIGKLQRATGVSPDVSLLCGYALAHYAETTAFGSILRAMLDTSTIDYTVFVAKQNVNCYACCYMWELANAVMRHGYMPWSQTLLAESAFPKVGELS